MTERQHTPGPWTYTNERGCFRIIRQNAPEHSMSLITMTNGQSWIDETNARLIAAAPDLLWFAEQVINGLETGMIRIETPADETLATVLARGRAAISKAKKESQP
jgi:hypothetical protein